MLTEKQRKEREASLGSRDAPIVAGVSPYKSPLELYYQLHGELPRYTDEESQAQRIGSKLEPMIAELAAEDLGYKIRRCPTRRHPKHPFMVANLDFEIVGGIKGPGVLECKNRGASKPFDTLPDDIMLQVVQQLAVTQREWGIVAVLFGFGTLKTYEVQRDKELEDYAERFGRNMVVEVDYTNWISDLAANKVRYLLKDLVEEEPYAEKIRVERYDFLRTRTVYDRCMEIAYKKWRWIKKALR